MKVTLETTDKIVQLGVRDDHTGEVHYVPARLWEGTTESGIQCHAFITRIAVHKNDDASQFERELQEQRPPTRELTNVYPARMVL